MGRAARSAPHLVLLHDAEHVAARGNTRSDPAGARARAGEFKADAHISWAIAVRTERRGRSLRSAQKRVSVGAGVCTGVQGIGTKSASSPLLDVVCAHKQTTSEGCTISCTDTRSSTGRAGARTAEVVVPASDCGRDSRGKRQIVLLSRFVHGHVLERGCAHGKRRWHQNCTSPGHSTCKRKQFIEHKVGVRW